jgi:hypothetical protein
MAGAPPVHSIIVALISWQRHCAFSKIMTRVEEEAAEKPPLP